MNLPFPSAFFAYPSSPSSVGEIIRTAIKEISKTGVCKCKGWEECKVGGKVIVQELCREIDAADVFCADLTGMNANVMFELGYAIAQNKRIWIGLDLSFVDANDPF